MLTDDEALSRARNMTTEPLWGDDWGDRSFYSLWAATLATEERRAADLPVDEKIRADRDAQAEAYAARNEKFATRRRSAPVEEKIRLGKIAQSKTAMGAAMRAALDKRDRRNGKEKAAKSGA